MRETARGQRSPVPPFWFRLPVPVGNAIQVAGMGGGGGLILAAATIRANAWAAALVMVSGFVLVYLCCHSIAHCLAIRVGVPGAPVLLGVAVLVNAYAAVMAVFNSRVDYAKAAASWQSAPPRSRERRPV